MANKESNMKLWDQVSMTNPTQTKPVEFGRKFTAIDAHYQIMEATRAFGPIGKGWGWDNKFHIEEGIAIAQVTIWWENRDQTFGPVIGMSVLKNKSGKIDDDAGKKATTDALTKCLSHLGFNADVFLGKFDDNKYVNAVTSAFKDKQWTPELQKKFAAIKNKLIAAEDHTALKAVVDSNRTDWTEIQQAVSEKSVELNKVFKDAGEKLKGKEGA